VRIVIGASLRLNKAPDFRAFGVGVRRTTVDQAFLTHHFDSTHPHVSSVPRRSYRSKDAAKALGARFDGSVKRWYVVEAGVDLVAFTAWLPAGTATVASGTSSLALHTPGETGLASVKQGIALSRLLNGVASAVAQAFASGVWTLVEVKEATVRNGHVYLEVAERDGAGQPIARARAMIWANTAARVLPEFEKATGAMIGAGIKLLVRARPVFKAQYGLSLEIDAIDSEYTLGDLEARKKEIRIRLQQEGVFERNRRLAPPWDFRMVLVVAPQDAAGLGGECDAAPMIKVVPNRHLLLLLRILGLQARIALWQVEPTMGVASALRHQTLELYVYVRDSAAHHARMIGSMRMVDNLVQKLLYRGYACARGAEVRAMSNVVDDSQCAFR
jgi:hypothetical protein